MNNINENSQFKKSPLDEAIFSLDKKILSQLSNPDELSILIKEQLGFLRIVYIMMLENWEEGQKLMEWSKKIIESKEKRKYNPAEITSISDFNYKVSICYFLFSIIINQFGRVLKNHPRTKNISLPLYTRIRFYRNKVVEHWEDYLKNTRAVRGAGCTFSNNKLPVPVVEGILSPKERKKIAESLANAFKKKNVIILIQKSFIELNLGSNRQDYSDFIFENLEKIDKSLNKRKDKNGEKYEIPDEIVSLLFEFGFPAPICDIEEYSKKLVEQLSSLL